MSVSGLGFYNAAVILQASKGELDTSVSAVSGATAVFFGVSGITSFVLSRKMTELDIRWFYFVGGLVGAGALVGLSVVDSVIELYVFFAVFGVGFALAGLVPATTVMARWFTIRRSVALSIGTTGLSMGGIAVTPFVARFIDSRGLAGAGPWLGLAWFIGVVPVAMLLIRSSPEELGLQPDGAKAPANPTSDHRQIAGATFDQAVSTRFFKFLAAAYALIFFAQVGAMAQIFNLATERVDRATATAVLSTLAFASITGRLIGGVVVTRIPAKPLTAILALLQGLALVLVAFADSRAAILASAIVLGVSVGNLLMLQPLLLAETFGVREYSRIYSFSQLFGTIGVASGPFVIGVVRDAIDYQAAFIIAGFGNVVGVALLLMTGSVNAARQTWASGPAAGRVA